ncbi:uncharacterized protein LOC108936104 isoform X1 [Scleropages formosus]|uniref:Uncharacterized LOC108936104 n=2 Tax=Scleropages formosus TaxID=113540 RepID=A0A8C9RFZ7_SCLFO|nr:uncharacterized protein LOC108936104 isoform X1 [Scleropages formosus]
MFVQGRTAPGSGAAERRLVAPRTPASPQSTGDRGGSRAVRLQDGLTRARTRAPSYYPAGLAAERGNAREECEVEHAQRHAMGNSLANTVDKWGLNPWKPSNKTRRKKGAPVNPSYQSAEAHTYDTVAEIPVYSVPNKKRKSQEELHYAEIEVLQGQTPIGRRDHNRTPLKTGTEYATIDFLAKQGTPRRNGSVKPTMNQKPADILIPTGDLQRPVPQPRLKKGSSQKSHGRQNTPCSSSAHT